MKFAVTAECLNYPLKKAIQTISQMGAQGVQFTLGNDLKPNEISDTGRRELKRYLNDASLLLAPVRLPLKRPLNDQELLDVQMASIKEAMTFCQGLQIQQLCLNPGLLPDEETEELKILSEVLNDLAQTGNHWGVTLTLSSTGNHAAAWLGLLNKIQAGPISLEIDPATLVLNDLEISEEIRSLHQYLGHVIVRDAARDFDRGGEETSVGRGEVPWEEVLAVLSEAEYRGWWTVRRSTGDDRIAEMIRAGQYLTNIALGF